MKKRIVSLFLSLLLCFSLGTTALAAGGFDATVTVDRETEGYIYVTVSADDSILGTKKPTLTVPCEFENVEVVFAGTSIDCTVSDGQVVFPVAAKGTYAIVALREVTFNDGSLETTRAVRHGVKITAPTAPTKTGYTFGGWYTDAAGTTAYNFDSSVTADITLYAKWVVEPRTVTFDSNGGSTVVPVTVDYGTAVTAPAVPTRNGYTFDGWYIDSECKTIYDFTTPVTANITLYAKWTYVPVYIPDTDSSGGSSNTVTSTETNDDGSVTKTTTNSATGTVTEATTYPNGVKSVTETTADGEITAAVTLPASVDSTVVTIPVTDATPGTVAVIIHPDGTEEIVQTCTVNENGVALIVDENVQVKIIDNSRSFTDVPNGEWYNDAVAFASARGIITGNTETTFDPTTATSRTMIWTMLARLSGEDTSTGETWWSVGQQWAIANGISDGSMSDQEIPREQLVTMLYRFAQLMGIDVSVGEDTNILSYNDAFDVSEWAIPAMQWACGAGVINGDGVNLMPSSVTSRAEVAQILMNFCECMTK